MICGNCGRTLDADEKFCAVCGTKVVHSEAEQTPATQENSNNNTGGNSNSGNNNQNNPVVESSPSFCGFCGSQIDDATGICPVCSVGNTDAPKGKFSKFKKFLTKKNVFRAAAVFVAALFLYNIYPYAKNAFMKLILPSDKYLAYVVGDNSDDMLDTFFEGFDIAKNVFTKGGNLESEITLKTGDGLEDLLDDVGYGEAYEYVDWVESSKVNLGLNYKDKKFRANLGGKLNDVNFGEVDYIVDMENSAFYASAKDYDLDYIGTEMGDSVNMDEGTDLLLELCEAFPDKKTSKKIVTRYAKAVFESIDDVEEETETIEADGVSQKVTALSFDVSEALAKDILLGVMNELKDDDDVRKIVDNFADVLHYDADYLFDNLDEVIEEIESYEASGESLGTITVYVNAKGEIAGYSFKTKGVEVNALVAEKGNKFGVLVEVSVGTGIKIEGGGKSFGNKKSGEFTLEAAGMELVKFDVKKLDTKKFKKGIFDGSVTVTCGKGLDMVMNFAGMTGSYVDDETSMIIDLLKDMSITFESSTKSLKDFNYTVSLSYQDKECFSLNAKSKLKGGKKVKTPNDYTDFSDVDSILDEIDTHKLFDKMRDANIPDEWVDLLESNI